MFVVIGVSFTLGITQGPSVTWHGMTWEVVLGFLSQTVVLSCHGSSLYVEDLSGESACSTVELVSSVWRCVAYSSKWLAVIFHNSGHWIWRLNQKNGFPEGEPLKLDITEIVKPFDCIAEGDEMCIVNDERDFCHLRIFDIRKCFEAKEFNVATGQRTVIPSTNNIIPVDSTHFGTCPYLPLGPAANEIYEIGSNKIVREWVGTADRHWGDGLMFTTDNYGRTTCSEALSGIHIVSFSVCSDDIIVSDPFPIS
ncbi:hypothetical protein Pelo_1032 [Pelomyxa schiedti]|nr:hypothetical protein Pelo_1032 [Pelomyxa schiedti]